MAVKRRKRTGKKYEISHVIAHFSNTSDRFPIKRSSSPGRRSGSRAVVRRLCTEITKVFAERNAQDESLSMRTRSALQTENAARENLLFIGYVMVVIILIIIATQCTSSCIRCFYTRLRGVVIYARINCTGNETAVKIARDARGRVIRESEKNTIQIRY